VEGQGHLTQVKVGVTTTIPERVDKYVEAGVDVVIRH